MSHGLFNFLNGGFVSGPLLSPYTYLLFYLLSDPYDAMLMKRGVVVVVVVIYVHYEEEVVATWLDSEAHLSLPELAQAAPGLECRPPTFRPRFLSSPFPAVAPHARPISGGAFLSPLPGLSPAPVSPP